MEMTLEEFERRAEADVMAFVASTRSAQAEGIDGFTPHDRKTREQWWGELAAYYEAARDVEVCDAR